MQGMKRKEKKKYHQPRVRQNPTTPNHEFARRNIAAVNASANESEAIDGAMNVDARVGDHAIVSHWLVRLVVNDENLANQIGRAHFEHLVDRLGQQLFIVVHNDNAERLGVRARGKFAGRIGHAFGAWRARGRNTDGVVAFVSLVGWPFAAADGLVNGRDLARRMALDVLNVDLVRAGNAISNQA
jgi:hypothetical protein